LELFPTYIKNNKIATVKLTTKLITKNKATTHVDEQLRHLSTGCLFLDKTIGVISLYEICIGQMEEMLLVYT